MSQPHNGSRSIIHTQSARTFEAGRLEVHSNMNFFTRATEFVGSGSTPANFQANNIWIVAANLALTYGITDNLDITIAPRLYQDTHYENEYNVPDDIFISAKLGSFTFAKRRFYGGFLANVRLGTGEYHNYPFTEYASGSTEYGFKGALSYFMDPYLPERSFNAHLNLGWWNHNEAGNVLYKFGNGTQLKATKNSAEFQYALGAVYPTDMFDFRFEVNGIVYTTQPDTMVYSRENWAYITPSIRYKALSWLSMDFGIDIRVTPDENETSGVPNKTADERNLPNYSAWKVNLGFNLKILPLAPAARSTAEIEKEEFNKRVEFFQNIVEERERTEDVQEELDRLKQEREQAEKELEELKQIMEEEGE